MSEAVRMGGVKLFSPAKINLFLTVLGRRPDGYHELWTLFERVSLGDEIELVKRNSGIRLRVVSGDVPAGPENLVHKAAELLKKEYGVSEGVEIRLKKRIPVSAGLGGGSSNAATVLIGLNHLWRLRLPKKTLLRHAAVLGSDVPFFILDAPFALGTGRGEILHPLGRILKKRLWHCIVKPPFGISTKEAYAGLVRQRRTHLRRAPHQLTPHKTDVKMAFRALKTGDSEQLSNLLTNSLELSINKRLTEISRIKKKLVFEGAAASLMSGSGSSVFGLFETEKKARKAAKRLRQKNRSWQVFVASTY